MKDRSLWRSKSISQLPLQAMTDRDERSGSLLAFASGCIARDALDRRGRAAHITHSWRGHDFRVKRFWAAYSCLPLVLPPTVLGYYLLQLLGRRSPLGYWLEQTSGITFVFHWSGAVIASAVAAFPLFLLPARGAFEAIDPALEDVARLLGRGELSVFFAVTLPLAWRGLAGGNRSGVRARPG